MRFRAFLKTYSPVPLFLPRPFRSFHHPLPFRGSLIQLRPSSRLSSLLPTAPLTSSLLPVFALLPYHHRAATSPSASSRLWLPVRYCYSAVFGWRFASPVRHIRSLAQCFFADKKSVFMTDKRHSIYVFFDICKITYLATFSAPILQRFQCRKTLHFMH